jgi:chromosome partitioning protein
MSAETSPQPRIIAITNHKGGVGKTSAAVNLAACLGRSRRVLLLDCDPQASASRWFDTGKPSSLPFLEEVLTGQAGLSEAIHPTRVTGVHLVPTSPKLSTVERHLAADVGSETVLRECLQSEASARFHYLILDSPPQLGMLSLNALVAAHELIIPVVPDPLAVDGLMQLLTTVEVVQRRLNHSLRLAGILLFRVRPTTLLAKQVASELAFKFPGLVYPTAIRETVRAAEAPSHHLPLIDCHPLSTAAQDYLRLAVAVIEQEEAFYESFTSSFRFGNRN